MRCQLRSLPEKYRVDNFNNSRRRHGNEKPGALSGNLGTSIPLAHNEASSRPLLHAQQLDKLMIQLPGGYIQTERRTTKGVCVAASDTNGNRNATYLFTSRDNRWRHLLPFSVNRRRTGRADTERSITMRNDLPPIVTSSSCCK